MPLQVNSRLGPYEIKSSLGDGGMGEVYRARDSRLNRDVAIKVIRADWAGVSELRGRFEREAHAVAALNHPNIVAVYDFGVEAGQQYIVSELVDGESLRALVKGKPVPARKLVEVAAQIADGIAAAHAAGIVHRDLKPENIMIAKDGRVKILDFGLARRAGKTRRPLSASDDDETMLLDAEAAANRTSEGAVLGTASYMSPEQAAGREVDYRSDQFSFGLLLYEMASGKQAFSKGSSVETMAAIVRDEPSPIDEKLPPPLRWIIDRCLAKEPDQRYESTRDLYRDLKNLRDHFSEAYSSGAFPQIATTSVKSGYAKFAAICFACMALAALLVYVLKPSGQNIGDLHYTPFATNARGGLWSPDGKAVAYTGDVKGTDQTFIKFLNSPTPVQLTHEQIGARPIGWSGDGSHILVAAAIGPSIDNDKILSFAAVGGEPDFIMNGDCYICTLSPDGKVLAAFVEDKNSVFSLQISDPIGSPFVPYKPDDFSKKEVYGVPQLKFSPDGKSILLIQNSGGKNQEAWLLSYPAGGKSPIRILPAIVSLQDTPSVGWMPDSSHVIVSVAADPDAPSHLWMEDTRSNDLYPLTSGIADEVSPSISPNGESLLLTQYAGSVDVVSLSVVDGAMSTLVSTGHSESMASWSGSKEEFVWVTNRSGSSEIWLRSPDGSDRPIFNALDFPGERLLNPSLSPNGDRIIFAKNDTSGGFKLWIASLSGGKAIRLTKSASGSEFGGAWSPDGSRFAYLRYGEGKLSILTAKTSGGADPVLLKFGSSRMPSWSPSGDWITCNDGHEWLLTSPDGKSVKHLGDFRTDYLAFSKDGKLLYGIQERDPSSGQRIATLFSLNLSTLEQKTIKALGMDYRPVVKLTTPSVIFSIAPDGKSFVYSTGKTRRDIWMLQGFKQPGWLDRLSRR